MKNNKELLELAGLTALHMVKRMGLVPPLTLVFETARVGSDSNISFPIKGNNTLLPIQSQLAPHTAWKASP